ncbi:MAG: hydantoin utilization protein A [Oscillatoriales cyanobacterium]|nr:MAG: hydantoin utilization protein A [Oscillatoriales cyanobacterium]
MQRTQQSTQPSAISVISVRWGGAIAGLALLLTALPAAAHHAMGGRLPGNAFEGFMSGLAHPVIGLDHLAFVAASGLVAIGVRRGWIVPVVFAIAALAGTALHLQSWDLPFPEVIVSASVVLFGALLAGGRQWSLLGLGAIALVAGIFHGYAYGESIVGAGMVPLTAYLVGFTAIQLAIALGVRVALVKVTQGSIGQPLRYSGFAIAGAGAAFLAAALGA